MLASAPVQTDLAHPAIPCETSPCPNRYGLLALVTLHLTTEAQHDFAIAAAQDPRSTDIPRPVLWSALVVVTGFLFGIAIVLPIR